MADAPDGDRELRELRRLAARAGIDATRPVERLEPPPPELWDRIVAGADPVTAGREGAGRPARRRRWVAPVLAAAAAVVAVAFVVSTGDGDEPEVLASSQLEQLGPAGSGSAELVDDGGTLRLRLATEGLDPGEDSFLEVWVIDRDVQRLVSLGPVREDGVYDLPPGLDPAAFPIVDVSVEPIDGDPTHSGASVLRGELSL